MIDLVNRLAFTPDPRVISHSRFYDNSSGKGYVEETLYAYGVDGKIEKFHFEGEMRSEADWAEYVQWALDTKGAKK